MALDKSLDLSEPSVLFYSVLSHGVIWIRNNIHKVRIGPSQVPLSALCSSDIHTLTYNHFESLLYFFTSWD